jgi:hypothetical protein
MSSLSIRPQEILAFFGLSAAKVEWRREFRNLITVAAAFFLLACLFVMAQDLSRDSDLYGISDRALTFWRVASFWLQSRM